MKQKKHEIIKAKGNHTFYASDDSCWQEGESPVNSPETNMQGYQTCILCKEENKAVNCVFQSFILYDFFTILYEGTLSEISFFHLAWKTFNNPITKTTIHSFF